MTDGWRFYCEWLEDVGGRKILCVNGPWTYDTEPAARAAYSRAQQMAWVRPVMHEPTVGPLLRVSNGRVRSVDSGGGGRNRAPELRAMLVQLKAKAAA